MTTVYLNRSDSDFWEMTFRQIVALIDNWRDVEKNRELMRVFLANGGDPNLIGVSKQKLDEAALQAGAVMW
jgi:hypothetical protein